MPVIGLDLKDSSTWRNIPSPVDVSSFQAQLTAIGGLVPPGYGSASGQPMFKILWAQEARHWENGAERLIWDERNLDLKFELNHYAVDPDVYARAMRWLERQNEKAREMFMRLSFREAYKIPNFTEYLKGHESTLNYRTINPEITDPHAIAVNIPPAWRYLRGWSTIHEIGQQCYYVVQWVPPETFGEEKEWNALRFDNMFFPEVDDVAMVDLLGPWPREGKWDHTVLRIANKVSDEFWNYREPCSDDLEKIRELIKLGQKMSDRYRSAAERSRERFRSEKERMDRTTAKRKDEFDMRFDEAAPVGKGAPTNISADKAKATQW